MKTQTFLLIICFIGLRLSVSGQNYAIDKNAKIISGLGSYLSQGGDLFENDAGNKARIINLTVNINHFTTKNLFIGGGIELSNVLTKDYKSNSIGFGPQIGYVFGDHQSIAYPFLDLGIRYYKINTDNSYAAGRDIFFGFGMIFPIKSHIGLAFEGGYHMLNLKNQYNDNTISGNVLSLSAGIAGLLFQDVIPMRYAPR